MKIKVNQAKIKRLIEKGMKDYAISRRLKIPRTVIIRVRAGEEVFCYTPKPRKGNKPLKKDICECCGTRKKAEGHRYLCEYCYKHEGRSAIYPETTINIY